ncbi:MarR family winged helix-turn-helix transcriptional regulator [Streptomyces sp. NPDC050145]|uniref:MarR family winged helix-turn-helix transcriptional regulator n=1 Tax=Streptomyces sp. NPDC050145 TaxID=3365602 RepID=UPI00378E9B67
MKTSQPAPAYASDQALWSRAVTLFGRVERELSQALQRRHGISLSEFRSLENLHRADKDELRMQDLAESVGLGQSSVTRLVARLEKAGYAYKDLCPSDKRGVYAVITEDGRRRYQDACATYAEVLSSVLNTYAADPELGPSVQALRGAHGLQ